MTGPPIIGLAGFPTPPGGRTLTAADVVQVVDALTVAAHLVARLDGWAPGSPWSTRAARDGDPRHELLADLLDAAVLLDPSYELDVDLDAIDDAEGDLGPPVELEDRLAALEWRIGALASDLGHHFRAHQLGDAELDLEGDR